MDNTVIRYAKIGAALVFFAMGLAGWVCQNEPAVCAWRGVIGAIVMYTVVRIAGAMFVHIVIDAAVEDELKRNNPGDKLS